MTRDDSPTYTQAEYDEAVANQRRRRRPAPMLRLGLTIWAIACAGVAVFLLVVILPRVA